jgi:hypothetical protein
VSEGTEAEVMASFWGGLDATIAQLQGHKALVDAVGLPLLLYECGPAGLGGGEADDPVIAAHRNSSMEAFMYEAYRRVRDEVRPELIVHFGTISSPSQYGSYNLVESYKADPLESPKFRAFSRLLDDARGAAVAASGASDRVKAGCAKLEPDLACPVAAGSALTEDDAPAGCGHGGACVSKEGATGLSGDAGDLCVCLLGFSGATCEEATNVDHVECGYKCSFDRGQCLQTHVSGIDRYFGCECLEGVYFGKACERFTCPDDCHWSGECVDSGVCHCFPGFEGDRCEVDCGCGGHGRCSGGGANRACACDDGFVFDDGAGTCVADCSWGNGKLCACEPGCDFGNCVGGSCECWAGYERGTREKRD